VASNSLIAHRRKADALFRDDYAGQGPFGRSFACLPPTLPFPSGSFDLVLCSLFLSLYSAFLNFDFHLAFLLELLRVGSKLQLLPLAALDGTPWADVTRGSRP
jgi:hypothetical protein